MEIEIFEEDGDHTLSMNNEHADFTIDVDPVSKTYSSRMSLKDDVYYRTQEYGYRIQASPIKVETRLIERMDEPPQRYSVKDGVVLEADIHAERGERMSAMTKEFIDGLKKEVEWQEGWIGDPVCIYILSLHPEIISTDDFRRYLRQLSEKIKSATLRVQEALKSDTTGIQVTDEYEGSGRTIWYPRTKQDEMSEQETEKAIEHANKIKEQLFDEKSEKYVGISEGDFGASVQILKTVDIFLNKKDTPTKKEERSKVSFGVKFGGFIFQWIWLFFVVSIGIWLISLVISIVQYSVIFALIISGIWAFILVLLRGRNS